MQQTSDKVRELAEKLLDNMSDRRGFHTDDVDDETIFGWKSEWESILRAELKPLLDAAQDVTECFDTIGNNSSVINRLAAELQGWRKE